MTLNIPLVGEIERRLLVNYRADPDIVAALLPAPFRPALVRGQAVVGVCLLRMGDLRPRGVPAAFGITAENAAHRIAVEWTTDGETQFGVLIRRRDTTSRLTAMLGGRVFPGYHQMARFSVTETADRLRVGYDTHDGSVRVEADVCITDQLRGSELFDDLAQASAFFHGASVGYSTTPDPERFDGLELTTQAWSIEPTEIVSAHSSYYDDPSIFPPGTIELDCALVMRNVDARWEPIGQPAIDVVPSETAVVS